MTAPATLGPYRVLDKLGQGGMGAVYLVADPQTGRELALKLAPRDGASPTAAARFQREAEALARIQHRNVVRIHAVGQLPQGLFILEERVEGETLESLLERGPLEPARAARIVAEVADAIEAVHAHGILYRDLKPANVVLRPGDVPVLLDFGLARDEDAERLTRTGALLGTPAYMAPEQVTGASLGPAVDVYGLGVLLYSLLLARPPFDGSLIAVLAALVSTEPAWPRASRPEVPAALDAVVRRAMARAPGARYASAAALRDDLRRALSGERVAASSRGAPGRRRVAVAVAVALAALVAALAAALAPPPARRVASPTAPAPTASVGSAAPSPRAARRETEAERRWRALPLPRGVRLGDAPGEYVAEKDGSVLLWVPGGRFVMGSDEAFKEAGNDSPAHAVRVSGFFIGKLEVTRGQWASFCAATGRAPPADAPVEEGARLPASASWIEARAYCAWAGLRLPWEAEWELAARGVESLPYPWGEQPPTPARARYDAWQPLGPAPVGSFPASASPAGCLDMAGNAWEWVEEPFGLGYGLFSFDEVVVDPRGPSDGVGRTLRGGAYDSPGPCLHGAYRVCVPDPDRRSVDMGFRVAASRP